MDGDRSPGPHGEGSRVARDSRSARRLRGAGARRLRGPDDRLDDRSEGADPGREGRQVAGRELSAGPSERVQQSTHRDRPGRRGPVGAASVRLGASAAWRDATGQAPDPGVALRIRRIVQSRRSRPRPPPVPPVRLRRATRSTPPPIPRRSAGPVGRVGSARPPPEWRAFTCASRSIRAATHGASATTVDVGGVAPVIAAEVRRRWRRTAWAGRDYPVPPGTPPAARCRPGLERGRTAGAERGCRVARGDADPDRRRFPGTPNERGTDGAARRSIVRAHPRRGTDAVSEQTSRMQVRVDEDRGETFPAPRRRCLVPRPPHALPAPRPARGIRPRSEPGRDVRLGRLRGR